MPRPLKLLLVTPKIEFTDDLEPEPSAQAGGFAPAVAAGDVDGQPPQLSQTITLDFQPEQIGIQFHHKTDRVHNVYPGRSREWAQMPSAVAVGRPFLIAPALRRIIPGTNHPSWLALGGVRVGMRCSRAFVAPQGGKQRRRGSSPAGGY
jgi:hypothetical protein